MFRCMLRETLLQQLGSLRVDYGETEVESSGHSRAGNAVAVAHDASVGWDRAKSRQHILPTSARSLYSTSAGPRPKSVNPCIRL